MATTTILVSGYTLQAIVRACVNINLFIDDDTRTWITSLRGETWYPFSQYHQLLDTITSRFADPAPILERIGIELAGFSQGGGPDASAAPSQDPIAYLRRHTHSKGYYAHVTGAPEDIGAFNLVMLNEAQGRATVHSTTPFSKHLERGILLGGFLKNGNYVYSHVDNSADPHVFEIEFH